MEIFTTLIKQIEDLKDKIQTQNQIPKETQDSRFLFLDCLQNAIGSCFNYQSALNLIEVKNTKNNQFDKKSFLTDVQTHQQDFNFVYNRLVGYNNKALTNEVYSTLNNLFFHIEKHLTCDHNQTEISFINRFENILAITNSDKRTEKIDIIKGLYFLVNSFNTNSIHTKENFILNLDETSINFEESKAVEFSRHNLLKIVKKIVLIFEEILLNKNAFPDNEVIRDTFASK